MANHERDGGRERRWRGVVKRFAAGGLTVRAFCRREGLPESAFYFWRRTLKERDAESPRNSLVSAFLPVAIQRTESAVPAAETCVELPGGLTIRCGDAVPVERIAALVRALQRREPQA